MKHMAERVGKREVAKKNALVRRVDDTSKAKRFGKSISLQSTLLYDRIELMIAFSLKQRRN